MKEGQDLIGISIIPSQVSNIPAPELVLDENGLIEEHSCRPNMKGTDSDSLHSINFPKYVAPFGLEITESERKGNEISKSTDGKFFSLHPLNQMLYYALCCHTTPTQKLFCLHVLRQAGSPQRVDCLAPRRETALIACLYDQNKSSFFGGPALFQPIRAF